MRRPPLRAHARPASLPLSYAQQRLWFIDQLEGGGSSGYILSDALKLDGPLDMDAFARAVNAIAARHEILRTRFVAVNGVPAQIIEPAMRVDLQYDDLSAQDQAAREALVDEPQALLCVGQRQRGGPCVRAQGRTTDGSGTRLTGGDHRFLQDSSGQSTSARPACQPGAESRRCCPG